MDESSSSQSLTEDRISDLPDNLIHMILSFIDMKYAVQTSILSKRWKYIWRSLSTLNLDLSEHSWRRTKFINFVYNVLLFRDDCRIQRFQLDFHNESVDSSYINSWITKSVKHNVEELCIKSNTSSNEFSIFSHCLCTCKSLTMFELNLPLRFNFGSKIVSSTSVILPRLKSMNLQLSVQSSDNVKLASELFTKFPALESLALDISRCGPISLRISVPTLKHISLTSDTCMGVRKVTLCAPNLSSFICFTSLAEDYRLENLSSLVTADVRINIGQDDKVSKIELREKKKVSYAQRMVKLLREIHNVKVLSLTKDFKVLAGAPEVLDCQLPEFPNLQRLILKTWLSKGCIDAIIHLLKESPNLEFLELNIEPVILGAKHIWKSGASLPFKHHLKHIVIRGLRGYGNNEVKFINIMLKNAMALEKVVLFGKFSEQDLQRNKRTKKFKATLLAYPGASTMISFRVESK